MEWKKQISFLKALTFLNMSSKGIILPFLPLFLYFRNFSPVEIGMIMGIAPMVSIIAQPFVGYLSDKYKTIKGILIILYFAVIATTFTIFFSGEFIVVFISFIAFHFALSPSTPLIDSMVIKSLGEKRQNQYGKIRLWGSIGFAITAVISGPVLSFIGIDKIYILFWILMLGTIILTIFLKDKNQSSTPVSLQGVKQILKNKNFMYFLFLCFLVMIPHRMNDTMIVLHLEELGGTELLIGLAWALAAFSEVPVFYYLSQRIMHYNHLFLLGLIAIFYTIRWLLYGLIDSPEIITALQLTQGITFGLFWLVALQTAVSFVPNHLRSTGQALLTSVCFGLGGAVGGTVGGSIFTSLGSENMYRIMASITFLATIAIFLSYRYTRLKER
ncbi:MFS transporter [Saliterribacillus persicus]|uniref:PPP family 3-phenylpropionic acid transporter n=1 Tax=Saliterribacillus persicus TaxID=930114 RepID=A0A368XEZ6_9BACI|nr:MFS transporter [Saliterribacillus persicus]RCW66425.1 PPP family 3-phenylpropionic acid transporter [Saliterribacillus persicus]